MVGFSLKLCECLIRSNALKPVSRILLFCFCFVFLRSTNSEKIRFSEHFFVSIAKENTCVRCQRKAINSPELQLLEVLIFLGKRPRFW